ncbi:MAG: ATPase [Hydrogenobaculum sp.]|nr:MAG: ATPase [Hydrogenobaculum sp.]HEK25399.1 ATP-binding protein [Hydrogenobaculum sp.]
MKRKDVFKQIIAEFHQWSFPKVLNRAIELPLNTGKIVSLIGARRSGKTYIMFQTIKRLLGRVPIEKILYVNFEDERLDISSDKSATPQDLGLLLEAYKELYPNISLNDVYIFFDEIQNVEGWEKFVRRVYDKYTKNIYVTGSNSKLLSKEIATALRGRTLTYEVFPLTFKEFLTFRGFYFEEIDFYNIEKRAILRKEFSDYLYYGAFPEVVFFDDKILKLKTLQNYFEVMFYRDLVERYKIKNHTALKYFIKRLLENIGKMLSVNNIFNELKSQGYKIAKDSLYEYLEMLQDVYFLFVVKKYNKSILKSESQRKAYLVDNGLLNALSFSFKEHMGTLLENAVVKEFLARDYNIFFFKEKKECDIIACYDKYCKPIQITYEISSYKTKQREIEGILEASKYLGSKEGIILTLDEKDELSIDGIDIKILPAYYYLLFY